MWTFYQSGFQPPRHGDGLWQPLAYAIDAVGVLVGILLIVAFLFIASAVVPFLLH